MSLEEIFLQLTGSDAAASSNTPPEPGPPADAPASEANA
jgi:hypothetical protein